MSDSPFVTLGLEPRLDLSLDQLERRYIELSRASHPDHNVSSDPDETDRILTRSANINDAYRVLRDPWRRARALVEGQCPGIVESTKSLPPGFLMEAMDLSEEVATVTPNARAALAGRIQIRVDEYFAGIRQALDAADAVRAATLLHESSYYRKALHDLQQRMSA